MTILTEGVMHRAIEARDKSYDGYFSTASLRQVSSVSRLV